MRLCSIASGSSGNCIYVGSEEAHVLVDVGISGKSIEKGLNSLDLTGKDVDGILITHEHSDHIKGLGVISRKYGIPIYTTGGTADAMLSFFVSLSFRILPRRSEETAEDAARS